MIGVVIPQLNSHIKRPGSGIYTFKILLYSKDVSYYI